MWRFSPKSADARAATTPDGERFYAIGDIHGCAELLDRLLDSIAADAGDLNAATLVFLGDYVDRGPDSRGVIDRLCALKSGPVSAVFLKGNHEAYMIDVLEGRRSAAAWLDWGGLETLRSYGVEAGPADEPEAIADALRAALPSRHRAFLESLELTHVAGDYLFVHAGVRPGRPLSEQTEEDLLWIRGSFHRARRRDRPDHVVVHGHQPVDAPLDVGWRVDVDTGACWTGKLTAVALEGEARRFLST